MLRVSLFAGVILVLTSYAAAQQATTRPARAEPKANNKTITKTRPAKARLGAATVSSETKAFWAKYSTAFGRKEALRAARANALDRLGDRAKRIHITPETSLEELLDQPGHLEAASRMSIKAARETTVRYHDEALIVEVEVAAKLRTVYAALKAWMEKHRPNDSQTIRRLEQLVLAAKDATIRDVGFGVPSAESIAPDAPTSVIAVADLVRRSPLWVGRKLRAEGAATIDANAPQPALAREKALKAAETDARQRLREQIGKLKVTPKTSVGGLAAGNEVFRVKVDKLLKTVTVMAESKTISQGRARCEVEITLRPLWDLIVDYQRNHKAII